MEYAEYAQFFFFQIRTSYSDHIDVVYVLNEGNNGVNIAKGTTDPRVEFISVLKQISNQILKF